MPDITAEELKDKADKLRRESEKYENVVFAIGVAYESDVNNVRLALHNADELMYVDKKMYYELHPEKKRGTIDKRHGTT